MAQHNQTSPSICDPHSLMPELWREIPGWEGLYEVSRLGEVRGLPKQIKNNLGVSRYWKARQLQRFSSPSGYQVVNLSCEGFNQQRKVHQLVLEAFVGPRSDGQQCRHLDNDPANNKLENLVWGSAKENGKDKSAHGAAKGDRNPKAKVTAFQAYMVQTSSLKGAALSKVTGLTRQHIYRIQSGRRWSWL